MQQHTRRTFGKAALAAIPLRLLATPDATVGGVRLGINAPYSFRGMSGAADDVLKYLTDLGLGTVELRSQPIENYFGAPIPATTTARRGQTQTPEQQEAAKAAAAALEKWRLAAPMKQFADFGNKWRAAGVDIEIVKFDAVDRMKDDVVDYAFGLAKAVGARAISCEIPVSKTKWLGEIAAKHKFMVGYHGHGDVKNPEAFAAPESWERSMSYSRYNGINLDIGHFTAGNSMSPIPFIRKYADRITHIHLKDRKLDNGPNQIWGQGDTQIREVLHLMKKEKYPFQATIEFEYTVPAGSTVMQEIAKCVAFCRAALTSPSPA
jgi:sugar phosphate isomerase/epimerase